VGLPGSATISSFFSITGLLLGLQLFEVVVETVEARLPKLAIGAEPLGNLLQPLGFEATRPTLGVLAARDEPSALQHFQVLRYRWKAHIEGLGQLHDGGFARGEASEDGSPGWVRESRKRGAEVVLDHVVNLVAN